MAGANWARNHCQVRACRPEQLFGQLVGKVSLAATFVRECEQTTMVRQAMRASLAAINAFPGVAVTPAREQRVAIDKMQQCHRLARRLE